MEMRGLFGLHFVMLVANLVLGLLHGETGKCRNVLCRIKSDSCLSFAESYAKAMPMVPFQV